MENHQNIEWKLSIPKKTMEMDKIMALSQKPYAWELAKRVVELEQINLRLQGKINELLNDINDLLSESHEMEDK